MTKLNYELLGNTSNRVLVLSNGLGTHLQMWDRVLPHLLPHFRILRYDVRGHGRSILKDDISPRTIEILGNDMIDLLGHLGIERIHFCGISMSGLIGQWLALQHPQRIEKLILSNTGAKIGEKALWDARILTIRQEGLSAIADATMERWFTEDFLKNDAEQVRSIKSMFLQNDVEAYSACCAAIRDADFRAEIGRIEHPVLIIHGEQDAVTTFEHAEYLRSHINRSSLVSLKTRHLAPVELPQLYATKIVHFLKPS